MNCLQFRWILRPAANSQRGQYIFALLQISDLVKYDRSNLPMILEIRSKNLHYLLIPLHRSRPNERIILNFHRRF